MPVTLTGKVFNDIEHLGKPTPYSEGISKVFILLESPTHSLIPVSTDSTGNYTFSDLSNPGTYIIHEIVNSPLSSTKVPKFFSQPIGFLGSTTPRQYKVEITESHLLNNELLDGYYFGHDFTHPFTLLSLAYQVNPTNTCLSSFNLVTGQYTTLCELSADHHYGALSFNPLDNHLYGYDRYSHCVFRLDATGSFIHYALPDLPIKNFNLSDITNKGHMILYESLDTSYYIIDVCPHSPHYMQVIESHTGITPLDIEDWSMNPLDDCLYGINREGYVIKLNPYTQELSSLITTGSPPHSSCGCLFDHQGHLYGLFKNLNSLYKFILHPDHAEAELFTSLSRTPLSSLARCANAPLYITLGSAPDSSASHGHNNYATTLAHNGPRHARTNLLSIESRPNLSDLYFSASTYTFDLSFYNFTGKDAYLYGWLDFNSNGIFSESESIVPLIIPSKLDERQTHTISFTVPLRPQVVLGPTYLRLRLTSDRLINAESHVDLEDTRSIGPASDGDILDLPLIIKGTPPIASESAPYVCQTNQSTSGFCQVTDSDNTSLTYTLLTPPTHGITSVHSHTGKWEYTPFLDYIGEDHFTLLATSNLSGLSCEVPTTIIMHSANLAILATVNKAEAKPLDTLIYTIHLENTGTLPLTQLLLTCPTPLGTMFVAGSALINDIQDKSLDPSYGIPLHKLAPSEVYELSFEYTLSRTDIPRIEYNATIECDYILTPNSLPLHLSKQSIPLITTLKSPELDIKLTTNKQEIFLEDTLQFTLDLCNTGDTELNQIKLTAVLGMELSYLPYLIVNYNKLSENLTSGYVVGTLLPGEKSTLQFEVKLSESPAHTTIDTSFLVSYDYLLGNEHESYTAPPLDYSVCVCQPTLELTKTTPKASLALGEIFTYTLTASNDNDFAVDDLIIKDSYPSYLQVLEVRSDRGLLYNSLDSGIALGSIPAHSSLHMYIKLKVLSIPLSKAPYTAPTTGIFKFKLPHEKTLKTIYIDTVDPIGILITDADLLLQKSLSVTETALGEVVTYTLTASNTGTVGLKDISIQDLLAPELKFIPGSVKLNNIPMLTASIISGITIPYMGVDTIQTITFDAKIISLGNGTIENTASAYYTYTPHSSHITKSGQTTSNTSYLAVRHTHLSIGGFVEETMAYLGKALTYHLTLTNDGDLDLFNVSLTNSLTSCELIDSTFRVNDVVINSVDLSLPINIGMIRVGKSCQISYTVIVSESYHSKDAVTNILSATFAYNTSDHYIKYGTSDAITLSIPLAVSTFKHLCLENCLEVPTQKPDIEVINTIGGRISLIKHYVVETPKGTSIEGQTLSGYKLIIHALLELTVEYVSAEAKQSIHSTNYSIPFSTFIVLPSNCPIHSRIHVETTLENISFKLLNNRSFFTNTSLLAIAKIS